VGHSQLSLHIGAAQHDGLEVVAIPHLPIVSLTAAGSALALEQCATVWVFIASVLFLKVCGGMASIELLIASRRK
jgi:hypothetical protein